MLDIFMVHELEKSLLMSYQRPYGLSQPIFVYMYSQTHTRTLLGADEVLKSTFA